jgi:formate C-acetyltransferase
MKCRLSALARHAVCSAGIAIACAVFANSFAAEAKKGDNLVSGSDKMRSLPDDVRRGGVEVALSPRIQRLLDRALDHDVFPKPLKVVYDPADEKLPEPVRIGKRLREYIAAQPVAIRADEELVGWLPFDGSVESDLYRRTGHKAFSKLFRTYYLKPKNRLAIFEWQHTCADFPKIIREGLAGIRREIAESRKKWAGNTERLDYLRGMYLALDGIEARAKNCAAACRRLAEEEKNTTRKATLLEMAERCDRVPMNPARTFDEGMQAVFFCYDFLSDAIGRIDQYLAPLYFADIAAGRITRERAAERLQELFIFIDAHTPHSSIHYDKGGECHMTVGGLTPDGKDGWTDFSRLVVESCLACDLKRPEMSFRWHPGTKREVLRFMLECEWCDPNKRIAFDGDVPRVAAFEKRFGFPPELARDYCITGCNEPTFMGGFSCGGFHMNAVRCLDTIFTARRAEAVACRTWDDFAAWFESEFRRDLEEADAISKEFNELRSKDCNVLSALFMSGCIERAKSPTRGGASRLVPVIDLLGTPNLIDSLCIVKQFVFDERRCTMPELADALAADWKGHEDLLKEICAKGKFYGANDPFSNGMARFVHSVAGRFAEGRRDWFGMPLTFGNHTGYNDNSTKFGRLTGATPDGRHAGEFLSFGGGPAGGHGPDAATSVLLAAAQMDPMGVMCGTSILNLSLPEGAVTDSGDFEKLVILVETYFRKGGLHLQLNHVSRETLIDAQKHPEKYPDLRVRVSGFSGYFVRFKKSIQDEIISRTVTTVR